jgi:hypothetical protein
MQPSKGLHNQVVKIVVPYCTVYSKLLYLILHQAPKEHNIKEPPLFWEAPRDRNQKESSPFEPV